MLNVARGAPLLFLLVLVAYGCKGSSGTACTVDADCSSSEVCAYPTSGCAAKGTCQTWDNVCDGQTTQACNCHGELVQIACGYPGSPIPIENLGACQVPTGKACASADDCDARALCAFPIKDGCSAKGTCVDPNPGCMTPAVEACGCDGTPIGINCIYGDGMAAGPVASMGPCARSDGGSDAGTDALSDSASDAPGESSSDAAPE